MKKGQKMKILMMDRNVGDYLYGKEPFKKYNPSVDGFSYGLYTHHHGICGTILWEFGGVLDKEPQDFEWEFNTVALDPKLCWWGPLPDKYKLNKINKHIKVGWRGPAIDMKNMKYLPKTFVLYDTWWDDYCVFKKRIL